jgi:hypothetical protein
MTKNQLETPPTVLYTEGVKVTPKDKKPLNSSDWDNAAQFGRAQSEAERRAVDAEQASAKKLAFIATIQRLINFFSRPR